MSNTGQIPTIHKQTFFAFSLFLALIIGLKLATPLLTVLFSYLALRHFVVFKRKWTSVLIFLCLVAAIFGGFVVFVEKAALLLPKIAEDAIPKFVAFLKGYNVNLPFSDIESLLLLAKHSLTEELGYLVKFAKIASKEFVYLVIGIVVAISLFFNSEIDLGAGEYKIRNNLYSLYSSAFADRFTIFYESFKTVMGAQLVISAVNTFFTGLFLIIEGVPYAQLLIVLTFLCGLLPIIGNLISNTIIFGVGMTVSANLAIYCLVFLIVLHKFEYFLNSKIIGGKIRNPMWLTLLSLIIGERLAGIPGMILAPVYLNYLKLEGSRIAYK